MCPNLKSFGHYFSTETKFPEHPRGQDEHLGALGGHYVGVGDGVGDGDVAVEADDDEVEDGGRTGPDVDRQPDGAPDAAEEPDAEDLVHGREGQDHHAQHEVGPRQRHDEEVGGAAKLLRDPHGRDHHHVPEDHYAAVRSLSLWAFALDDSSTKTQQFQ